MAHWIDLTNGSAADLAGVGLSSPEELTAELRDRCRAGQRPVAHFGMSGGGRAGEVALFSIVADDATHRLSVGLSRVARGSRLESLTPELPAFQLFERELHEEHGLDFSGHPWLKPVRYSHERFDPSFSISSYPFYELRGSGVHEVAVGPVHAGVIEPGHFRFMCRGERVEHLEIQLGYQHRGVEALFTQGELSGKGALAEAICGTTSVAHAVAYARVVEATSDLRPPAAAERVRALLLELERVAGHLATLGALAGDVAYLPGASVCAGLRTVVINSLLELTGSRFGRGMVRPGGLLKAIDLERLPAIRSRLIGVAERLEALGKVMWSSPSVLSRFERTGRIDLHAAQSMGLVGPVGRASGLDRDIRRDHPVNGTEQEPRPAACLETSGDVFARAMVRHRESLESLRYLADLLAAPELLAAPPVSPASFRDLRPKENCISVSLTEGLHGEIAHVVVTDHEGGVRRYKIKDPSFNNWFGLAWAVRGEGVSDFPLCNKSFDLSYAAHDL